MDLNQLYSRHQIALMNAGAATGSADRHRHLDCASEIARHIVQYQSLRGAAAARSWQADRQPRLMIGQPACTSPAVGA